MRIGLKIKSVVGVVILFAIVLLMAWFGMLVFLEQSSTQIEKVLISNNLKRVSYAVYAQRQGLDNLCRDWAWWDSSYEFMGGGNSSFKQSNLNDEILINLNLDMVLFFDSSSRLYSSVCSPGTKDIQEYFSNIDSPGNSFISSVGEDGVSGLLRVKHKILMISAQRILNSSATAKPRGVLLMARLYGDMAVKRLGDELLLDLSLKDVSSLPPIASDITTRDNCAESVCGFKVVRDIYGDPMTLIHLRMQRYAHKIGHSMADFFVLLFLAALILIGSITAVLININFISRVKSLQFQLRNQLLNGEHRRKVFLPGDDELTDLSEAINETLTLLQEEKDKSDNANRVKTEFLANMSHEIRTPMHSILGMTELLRETELDNEQLSFLNVVGTSGESLLEIINDVLEISKIEAGHLEIETHPFLLHEMTERVCNMFFKDANQKGLDFFCDIQEGVPDKVIGDPTRLRQILTNLISNAIKFTSEGKISLRVYLQNGVIFFSVSDTGIGISEDKMDYIFESFTQADSSTTRKYGGTGLGLPISKKLVGLMNGEMKVTSEEGRGTEFVFYVDLKEFSDDFAG